LLLASFTFYAIFDLRFLALLLFLIATTFYLGKSIHLEVHPRCYVWLSAAINLVVLGVFKYYNFFIDNLKPLLQIVGVSVLSPGLALLLPVGISFYTFQAIAYTTEIYRRKLQPADSLVDFALYLAFFPKLIAGPFVRPAVFLEQLKRPAESYPRQELSKALGLLLLGLFKKIAIADSLASQADVAFQAAAISSSGSLFLTPLYIQGFYLYAFQIYADFSGYTDIARASAALLGFQLPENFRRPYFATTVAYFWNYWHMTLTQWFREYLFFPLSRGLLSATHRRWPSMVQIAANLLTMTLIGLWHGAAWTYITWGLWHGVLLTIERLLGWKPSHRVSAFVSGLITFHLVGLGWVLFRSPSFTAAVRFYQGLFSFNQLAWLTHYAPSILFTAGLVFGIDLASKDRLMLSTERLRFLRHAIIIAALFVVGFLSILGYIRGTDVRPFIYGQF
jgi:alginate O-acetyltransferase complex protein AlgI